MDSNRPLVNDVSAPDPESLTGGASVVAAPDTQQSKRGLVQAIFPKAPTISGDQSPFRFNRLGLILTALMVLVILVIGSLAFFLGGKGYRSGSSLQPYAIKGGSLQALSSENVQGYDLLLTPADKNLSINGAVAVNGSFTLAPSSTPGKPTAGQMYFDNATHLLNYYNGSAFVALQRGSQGPQGLQGSAGNNGAPGAAGVSISQSLSDALNSAVTKVDSINLAQVQSAASIATLLSADTVHSVVTNTGSLIVEAPGTSLANCNYSNFVSEISALSPKAYWKMEDTGATASDSSGNNNTGNLVNVTNNQTPGPVSCANSHPAMSFNGTNSYIKTTNTIFNPPTYTEIVSFKTTSDGPLITLTDGSNFDRIIYVGTDGKLYAATYDGGDQYINSAVKVNDGKWHEAVAIFSASTGESLYLDGNLVASNPTYVNFDNLGNEYWQFGTTPWQYYVNQVQWYNGEIGQAATISADITSTDIHNIAVAGGYTGLDTTQPPANLTVAGNVDFQNPSTNQTVLYVDSTNNRVGINTSGPNATLEVNGMGASNVLQIENQGAELGYFDSSGNLYLTNSGGNDTIGFANSGNSSRFALSPYDTWQTGYGYNQQINSYYGLQIDANAQGGYVPQMNKGSLYGPSVSIYGGQPTAPVVALQGASSQTGDLLDLQTASTTLDKFTASGALQITGNAEFHSATCNYSNYVSTINGLAPAAYWNLEDTGSTAADSSGNNDTGTLSNVTVNKTPGPFGCATSHPAMSFSGANSGISTPNTFNDPPTFTEIAMFKTTGTGPIVEFDNGGNFDRILYVGTDGKLYAGSYAGGGQVINSAGVVNDGKWHEAVAKFSATSGQSLYLDGNLVASNSAYTTFDGLNGTWKIGNSITTWYPNQSQYFSGEISQVAVIPSDVSSATINTLYADSGLMTAGPNQNLVVLGDSLFQASADSINSFQIQNSNGTALLRADTQNMILTVASLVINTTLTVDGHIISGGSTPTAAVNASHAGTGASCNVAGNDTAGKVTIATGTGTLAGGNECTLTYAGAYAAAPQITLTPASGNTAAVNLYSDSSLNSTTSLDISFGTIPAGGTYTVYYHVIQ